MPFYCAIVAKLQDCSVLASAVNPGHPNADIRALSECLGKAQGKRNNKLTLMHQGCQVNISTDDSYIIAVSTAEAVQKKAISLAVEDVKRQFCAMYTEPVSMLSSSMCTEFNGNLEALLKKYAASENGTGKVREIQGALDDVRDVMTQNIDKVIERNGKIESIVERSEELDDVATTFRRRAKTVQKKMWWNDMRMKIFLGVGIIVVILVISMIACGGPTYKKCT